ncbi:hypothetical protein [Rhodomicrobium sp. R_RK_3]|uniref:hypothetical protein n=1 Tax=Rhodomicrobium sp. R_RK_3 TaxID=2029567 RepID=UPI000F74BA01|nr:hypothetical protein [Rhodomicrobium sp. R_RK_3]
MLKRVMIVLACLALSTGLQTDAFAHGGGGFHGGRGFHGHGFRNFGGGDGFGFYDDYWGYDDCYRVPGHRYVCY